MHSAFWKKIPEDFGRIEVTQVNQILKTLKRHCIFFFLTFSHFHLFTEAEITWWRRQRRRSFLFSGRFSGSEVQSAEPSEFITASQAGQRNPGDFKVLILRPAKRAIDTHTHTHARMHAHTHRCGCGLLPVSIFLRGNGTERSS